MAAIRSEPRYDPADGLPGREAFRRGSLLYFRPGTFVVTAAPLPVGSAARRTPPRSPSGGGHNGGPTGGPAGGAPAMPAPPPDRVGRRG